MISVNSSARKHLTDIHEWRKLGEANIFSPVSRLELIYGEILDMSPIGFNHAGHVVKLMNFFAPLVHGKAIINAQNPIQLGNLSEPEPDFMLLRPHIDFYTTAHPKAEDVLLLVEVADSSLYYDQNEKQRLYAHHNITEYWLLNLNETCLEVYLQPHNDSYQQKMTLGKADSITLSQLQQITISLNKIL